MSLFLFNPAAVPVVSLYVLAALLLVLVPVSRRQRLHVGHGMTLLMLFMCFGRVFFFDHDYETYGEGSFYIWHMLQGTIPGLDPIYAMGGNPPAMFSLFYFTTYVVGLDPVVSLKAFRLILSALDILLMYLLGRRLFPERYLAFAATLLFAWSEIQLSFFEADQFKNLLGHTFFLAFVVVAMDWLDALGTRRPGQRRRLVCGLALALGMILSHQVYLHVLAGILVLATVGLGIGAGIKRLMGRRPGMGFALVMLGAAGLGYSFWFKNFLPNIDAEGLIKLTEYDYGSLSLLDEVRRPGVLLYNVWLAIATVGALQCARREGDLKSRALLLTFFGLFSVLAKQYVIGLLFQPVRFLMIDGPFLCLFSIYALWRLSLRVSGIGKELFWVGVGLLILANLSVLEFGSVGLGISRKMVHVTVGTAPEYLFGGSMPGGQLWLLLLLSAVLVAVTGRATWEPERRVPEGGLRLSGLLFLATAVAGVVLAIVGLYEPVLLQGIGQQFVALLFPVWALGLMPWRAMEPAGDQDQSVMRLAMVSVTSLLVFVVLWYVVLLGGGSGFDQGTRWSTMLTFLVPAGSLVILAGFRRPGGRWRE